MEPEWIQAMQEELQQFELNNVWELVKRPDPRKHNIIGTKGIYHNKQDEHGQVVRNKARLVAQGYTQVEGIDFDETNGSQREHLPNVLDEVPPSESIKLMGTGEIILSKALTEEELIISAPNQPEDTAQPEANVED